MVRHECAEALGAIGSESSKPTLQCIVDTFPHIPELSDTCRLAIDAIRWRAEGADLDHIPAVCACMINPYSSVDPAPPHPSHELKSPIELGDILCDADLPILERYRAMFSLRNKGGAACVEQLCRALTTDTSSPLLRHEVAYVLGQLQHPDSVDALEVSLRRLGEHEMVRHESAEGRWQDCERILTEFASDENVVVRESCLVALDAANYWGHSHSDSEVQSADEESLHHDASGASRGDTAISFSRQKNGEPTNRILVGHFNIKT
jgi:deoxyhypusine monooxygenase